jgi:hypothetical protein
VIVAGQGFKDFVVGEVLTSSDVDGFLMQQSVMRFADDGARGSALGTAVGTAVPLAEGMVAYLDDVNYVQVYNGSAWTSAIPGIGSNVVQAVKTDPFTTTSTTFTAVTGLSVTITPSSETSKILVIAYVQYSQTGTTGSDNVHLRLTRGGSPIFVGNAEGSRTQVTAGGRNVATAELNPATPMFLDSPATASPVTYAVEMRCGTAGLAILNRTGTNVNTEGDPRGPSSITAHRGGSMTDYAAVLAALYVPAQSGR